MPSTLPLRPDTPIGRALAGRAVHLAEAMEANAGPSVTPPAVTALAPTHIRDAAKDALARGETHYTARPGVLDLRKAIARRSTGEGFPATAESVVVTNGGAEALYIALQAVVGSGDRVAAPEPIQTNVAEMIGFIGGDLRRIATTAETRFLPTVHDIFAVDPSVILLASPSPITGAALDDAILREIVTRAAERDVTVILDRSFVPALYDPAKAIFSAPDLGAAVVTIGSFSAGYGLDGWRVGYFTAPPDRMKAMRELKQAMSICTTAVSQFAALAAIDGPDGWLDERRAGYAKSLARATSALSAAGIPVVPPDAYPWLLVDVRGLPGAGKVGAFGALENPLTPPAPLPPAAAGGRGEHDDTKNGASLGEAIRFSPGREPRAARDTMSSVPEASTTALLSATEDAASPNPASSTMALPSTTVSTLSPLPGFLRLDLSSPTLDHTVSTLTALAAESHS